MSALAGRVYAPSRRPGSRRRRAVVVAGAGAVVGHRRALPAWHASPVVHARPSLHAVPFGRIGLLHSPVAGSHAPAAWHASCGGQVTVRGRVAARAAWHFSPLGAALPSSQAAAVDLGRVGAEARLRVAGAGVVARSSAVHTTAVPAQVPADALVVCGAGFSSLQVVSSGFAEPSHCAGRRVAGATELALVAGADLGVGAHARAGLAGVAWVHGRRRCTGSRRPCWGRCSCRCPSRTRPPRGTGRARRRSWGWSRCTRPPGTGRSGCRGCCRCTRCRCP